MRKVSPLKNPFNSTASTSNCSQFPNIFQYNDRRLEINSQASSQSICTLQNSQFLQMHHNRDSNFIKDEVSQTQQMCQKMKKFTLKQSQLKTNMSYNQQTSPKNEKLQLIDDLNINNEFEFAEQLENFSKSKQINFFNEGIASKQKLSLRQASQVFSQDENFPFQQPNFGLSRENSNNYIQPYQKDHTLINEVNQSMFQGNLKLSDEIPIGYKDLKQQSHRKQDQAKTKENAGIKPRKKIFDKQSKYQNKRNRNQNSVNEYLKFGQRQWLRQRQRQQKCSPESISLGYKKQQNNKYCIHAEVALKSLQIVDKMLRKPGNQQPTKEVQQINFCKLDIKYRKKIAQIRMQIDSFTNLTIEQIINQGKNQMQQIHQSIQNLKLKIISQEYLNPYILQEIQKLSKLNFIIQRAQTKYLDYRVKLAQLKEAMVGQLKTKKKQKLRILKSVNVMINALEQQIQTISGQKVPIQQKVTRFFKNQRNLLIESFEVIKHEYQSQYGL